MELVQNFSTIEFAVAENPHGDGQTKKIPPQKRFRFSEFSLDMEVDFLFVSSPFHFYDNPIDGLVDKNYEKCFYSNA